MPPRYVVATIIAFWIASIGYFIYREYLPWWRTDAPPPFLVELADEAAPLIGHWSVHRGDQKIGSASTKMTCLKDNTVELASEIENLEINMQALAFSVQIRITKLRMIQWVTREGQLLRARSRLQLALIALGQKFEMKATIEGVVKDGKLHAKSILQSPLGRHEQELDPIPMQLGTVLNPMQPIAKLRVHPGQHWKMANVDPLGEAMNIAFQHLLQQITKANGVGAKLRVSTPSEILAEVDRETQEWKHEEKSVMCYVIRYRSDDEKFTGSTWVSVDDGKVMRQEVTGFGEKLVLEREN